jgi:hypothetical protein
MSASSNSGSAYSRGNSRRTSALTAKSGRALEKGLAMRTV